MGQRRSSNSLSYLAPIGVFLTMLGLVTFLRRNTMPTRTSPLDFVMLGLATFRMGRLVAFDKVAVPLRAPFTRTVRDDSGAGDTVVATGGGLMHTVGELISCPICAGTWIAAGLVYGLQFFPTPTRLLIAIMSATGLAELLNAATEALSWLGQAEREEVGEANSTNRKY